MATITGELSDVGFTALTGRAPILRFHPRSESGSLSLYANRVLSHTPVDATINGAVWTVDLVPTIGMVPLSWYELELIEVGPGSKVRKRWWWGARIYFGIAGGDFASLPGGPTSPESVCTSLSPPPNSWRGYWLYSPGAGEVMPLNDPRIGDLIPGPGPFII